MLAVLPAVALGVWAALPAAAQQERTEHADAGRAAPSRAADAERGRADEGRAAAASAAVPDLTRPPGAAPARQAARDADPPEGRASQAPVGLDRLLRLPDSYSPDPDRRAGASQSQWRERFFEARERVQGAREALERMQTQLEGLAGDSGQWAASAPGLGNADPSQQTLSYKLRQDLRAQREAVLQAERRLLDLQVEADLAGVPPAWRE